MARYFASNSIYQVLRHIRQTVRQFETPVVIRMSEERGPFHVLVSCILSLRTRDEVTFSASSRLFAFADTPEKILIAKRSSIEKAIYPAAFFRVKTETLRNISRQLLDNHGGHVPKTVKELLQLKGVGRKTANLTVVLGYGKLGICVDTHVHRIVNRLGYVDTRTPNATEFALRDKLPKRFWKEINGLLVTFGQNVCKPVSPICSSCAVAVFCKRVGVKKSR